MITHSHLITPQTIEDIQQAVIHEDIAYFHQQKQITQENVNHHGFIECLNLAFMDCLKHKVSWEFTQQIIELGANNFSSVLIQALYKSDYLFIDNLFKVKPRINPFQYFRKNIDEQFLISHLVNLGCNKDSPINTAYLFDCIVKSFPNHTKSHKMPGQMTYYRYDDNYSLLHYADTYNELLYCFLVQIHYPLDFDRASNPEHLFELLRAVRILSQRSFPLSNSNKNLLLSLKKREPETFASFSRRMSPTRTPSRDDYIFEADKEFYCTDMAQRKLTGSEFNNQGHSLDLQKFRVYLEMARHFKAPASLNKSILQAILYRKRWVYQKRILTMEEYQFLKTLKNSTANHQRLLNFYNRYFYFDRANLHDILEENLGEYYKEEKEMEESFNKI
jgi:hypothetical protein